MRPILLTLVCATALDVVSQRADTPTVPDLLAAAGRYVAEYESAFAVIVSEERYVQTANLRAAGSGPKQRVMKSDLLTYYNGAAGWIGFRDVVEVDGKPVADHVDRLLKLAFEPTADALEDARRSTAESARYNIGSMTRTINVPTIALMFLRRENQQRSTFAYAGPRYGRVPLDILTFKETSESRLIRTADNAAASGRFWIDARSGRVEHTELTLTSREYSAKIVVDYANQPKLELWVPIRMTEEYAVRDDTRIAGLSVAERTTPAVVDGRADYGNFRKFETKAGLVIKKGA